MTANNRSHFRFAVERRAALKYQGSTTACDLHNLTEDGLQLSTEIPIPVGATIQLECRLEAHTIIDCAVLITHATHPYIGGRITEISPEHRRQLIHFIQQLIETNLGGM